MSNPLSNARVAGGLDWIPLAGSAFEREAPQPGHARAIEAPHWPQQRWSAATCAPHLEQTKSADALLWSVRLSGIGGEWLLASKPSNRSFFNTPVRRASDRRTRDDESTFRSTSRSDRLFLRTLRRGTLRRHFLCKAPRCRGVEAIGVRRGRYAMVRHLVEGRCDALCWLSSREPVGGEVL